MAKKGMMPKIPMRKVKKATKGGGG